MGDSDNGEARRISHHGCEIRIRPSERTPPDRFHGEVVRADGTVLFNGWYADAASAEAELKSVIHDILDKAPALLADTVPANDEGTRT